MNEYLRRIDEKDYLTEREHREYLEELNKLLEPKKATLEISTYYYKRTKRNCDYEFTSSRPICICSKCKEIIISPANGYAYKYCYNCGAKFEYLITAQKIKEIKASYNLESKAKEINKVDKLKKMIKSLDNEQQKELYEMFEAVKESWK